MKLSQLRNVIAIAERGSLRAASRQLDIAQPALTRSIRELEKELGTVLFERRSKGMVLTPIGEVLLRRARAVQGEIRRAEEEISQVSGGTGGTVVAALSIAPHLAALPKVIEPFRRRYPDVSLNLIEGVYPTIEGQLRDGSIDFYAGPQSVQPPPPDLLEEELCENQRVIISRKKHPLSSAQSLSDLVGAEWATTSITVKAEDELNALFKHHALPLPRLRIRTQSALSLMICVAHTDTLAVVPHQWVSSGPFADSIHAIPVGDILPKTSIIAVRRSGLPLTPAAEHLLDLIRRRAVDSF